MIPTVRILQGDWIEQLRTLADCSVHMCVTSPPYWGLRSYLPEGHPLKPLELGQEKTPEEYVAKLVEGFREVRRVLRDDGTLWLNLGDSSAHGKPKKINSNGWDDPGWTSEQSRKNVPGFKAKDICMIPARVAIQMQSDGWSLRSEITWCKRSCMPEPVDDRPTNATEKIFLLAKQKHYFYDGLAVRNPYSEATLPQMRQKYNGNGQKDYLEAGVQNPSDTKRRIIESLERNEGSNLRNYWLLGPEPYQAAHFATFPTEIPRRAILLGTSAKGCCPECGAPWKRIVETEYVQHEKWFSDKQGARHSRGTQGNSYNEPVAKHTIDWQPTCDCGCRDVVPCTVLDCFGGSGTTGEVATELGRNAILIELNPEYHPLIKDRTFVTPGLQLT